ncbi:MAG: hypothetical protein JSU70_01850 [Phycisphaerales bacterium]|nr:MAG: hypothetical protein JSU70_01850 [Phycisphaerales bacterium]
MLNVFEQPWTLVGVAVVVLFGVLTFRGVWDDKRHWWQWLIPLLVAGSGFGLDALVRTDLEKINAVIETSMRAVEQEDCAAIASIIADDYHDSHHNTKEHLIAHCRNRLSKPVVEKNTKTALRIEISPPRATAVLTTVIKFEKESDIYQNYRPFAFLKLELHLLKQADKEWLINRVELLEVDRMQASWRTVR